MLNRPCLRPIKYVHFHQTRHVQNFMRAEVQLILADIGLDSSSFHLMVKGENMVLQWPCTQTTGNFADVVYMLLLVIFTKRQCHKQSVCVLLLFVLLLVLASHREERVITYKKLKQNCMYKKNDRSMERLGKIWSSKDSTLPFSGPDK